MSTVSREDRDVLLRAATAAPSLHNTQPWRFDVSGDTVDLHGDPTRRLAEVDPDARQLHVSCGAALMNLRVAARRLGYEPVVSLLPDPARPTLLARVTLRPGRPPTVDEAEMYAAIPRRHTTRTPFEERALPEDVVARIVEAAALEGTRLHVVNRAEEQARLRGLVHEAELDDATDPRVRAERAAWVSDDASRDDGVPLANVGPVPADVDVVFRDLAAGRALPDRTLAEFESRPTLAVLCSDDDRPRDWVRAGEALERVLLLATVHGVAASFVNQPLERPDLRWLVRDPASGIGYPQMLVRLGYGQPPAATPRRPLDEVVTNTAGAPVDPPATADVRVDAQGGETGDRTDP